MEIAIKLAITLILFSGLPYVLALLLKRGITRKRFALLLSVAYGFVFFLISIMFVEQEYSLVIGILMCIGMIVGIYPTIYLLYPHLIKTITRNY